MLQKIFAAGVMLSAFSSASAEETGAAGIPYGPVTVYPDVGLSLAHDDNIYLNNADRQSANYEIVSPGVKLVAQNRDDIYSLDYQANLGRYNSGNTSNNNYNDQSLIGKASVVVSTRAVIKLMPEFVIGHDQIGSTYGGIQFTPVPNKWRNTGLSGVFGYGSEGAKGRVELAAGYLATKYLNNRDLTFAYDKHVSDLGGTFFYRIMPKTSLLFQAKEERVNYDNPGSVVPNNTLYYYLVGAKWEATAKTTGDFRIGQIQDRYDGNNPLFPNFSGIGWEGKISWNPKDYSRVKFDLSKQPIQTTLVSSNTDLVNSSTVDWSYDWSNRFTSHLIASRYTENFGGAGVNTVNNSYGISADYQFRRWLKANLGWTTWAKTANSVTIPGIGYAPTFFDYNRNLVMLTLTGTL